MDMMTQNEFIPVKYVEHRASPRKHSVEASYHYYCLYIIAVIIPHDVFSFVSSIVAVGPCQPSSPLS